MQADVASLARLPGPTDLIFSRQMMQHMCNSDVGLVIDLISRSGARCRTLAEPSRNLRGTLARTPIMYSILYTYSMPYCLLTQVPYVHRCRNLSARAPMYTHYVGRTHYVLTMYSP